MITKKLVSAISLTLAAVLLLGSCGKEEQKPDPEPAPKPEVVTEAPAPKEPEPPKFRSPLTGLPTETDLTSRRPVAIMINNIKKALPQYGIAKAQIIFEALAEGGITRLLAVFEDVSSVPQIGTIRSSRPYYLDFAQSLDAVYIHIGGSPEAYSEIKKRKMDSFDLIAGQNNDMYWRDKSRIKSSGYEHSVFTSGDRIMKKLNAQKTRMTKNSDYGNAFLFDENAKYEGNDATKITAVFSTYKTGTYTYDKSCGLYRIGQYGTAHVDAAAGSQLAFKNVFILRINSYVIKGDSAGRLKLDTVGEGKGMYFVNGTQTAIKWKKSSKSAPFKLYTVSGEELKVVPGDSYVAIVPKNASVTVSGSSEKTA